MKTEPRERIPPTIAQTFVRKCKNGTCSSVKVTYIRFHKLNTSRKAFNKIFK